MDKESFLQAYMDIETKTYIKADKTKRLDDLISNFQEIKGYALKNIIEIVNTLIEQRITIRQPLFKSVIYPILSKYVERNEVNAIKTLIKLEHELNSYQAYTKENKFTTWCLIEAGLKLAPNDKELLQYYEQKRRKYLEYTLHELPTGVLYGADGATIHQCEELLDEVKQYEEACNKLMIDQKGLIEKCRFYYAAYRDYLAVCTNYNNFSGYLDKHHKEKVGLFIS